MQTVIVPNYLFSKTKMGTYVILGTMDLSPLQLSSPSCLNIIFCLVSHHRCPQQTTSLASSQNMALTCVFLLEHTVLYYVNKNTSVFQHF